MFPFTPFLAVFSYMVMPFVAQDLGHIMKKKKLSDCIIAYLFYQLLRGLKVRCGNNMHDSFMYIDFRLLLIHTHTSYL